MRVPGFVKTPFAFAGDKATIPEATQPGGQVSFTQGFGPDYQKDLASDPDAKAIDRAQTNQLMYLLTTLVQRWQSETFPEWIDTTANGGAPYPYPYGAIVRVVSGVSWVLRMSTKDANTSTPSPGAGTADWADVGAALAAAVLTNATAMQTMVGPLTVGAGSLLGGATPPLTANDKRLATLEWVTAGKNSAAGVSDGRTPAGYINRVTLPKWFSSDGTKNYNRAFGVAELTHAGVSAQGLQIYTVIGIPVSPAADISQSLIAMHATINANTEEVPGLGVRCRLPDYRNLSIAVTSNVFIGPTVFVSWSVEYWT